MIPTRALIAAAAILVTSGAPVAGASAAAPGDACALLDRVQVSAALGATVAPGQRLVPRDPRSCGWAEPGGPRLTARKVVLTLMTERQFDVGKQPMQGITKTPAPGIGDDAYYVTAKGLGTALNVRKGAFFFQVKVGGTSAVDAIKAAEKKLALEVLPKV